MYSLEFNNVINYVYFVICHLPKCINRVRDVFIVFGHSFTERKKLKNNDLKLSHVIYFKQLKNEFLIYLLLVCNINCN